MTGRETPEVSGDVRAAEVRRRRRALAALALGYTFRMMAADYARFTEEANALDYLEKTIRFINDIERTPLDWKWVMLAIHGALYSFMICALKGTTPDNVCIKTKSGKQKLIDFFEALKRCQDSSWMNISGFTNLLQLTDKQQKVLSHIHKFRNNFVHYGPACWSIELAGMRKIVAHGLDVLRFISLEMGCYYVHYEAGDQEKIAGLINEGKNFLRPGL